MTKISIIMPVYNIEPYLTKALDSAVGQTLEDIEILCIDDKSTDNSLNILKEYAQKDNRIKIIEHEKNLGQAIAKNNALDIAQGEYIMFLDPDDWLEPDACEKAYKQISQNKNDFVMFDYYKYFESNGKYVKHSKRSKSFKKLKNCPNIKLSEDMSGNYLFSGFTWCQIYDRNFLNKFNIRFPDYRNGEDVTFFIKCAMCSNTISVIFEPLYNYRIRSNSTSSVLVKNFQDLFEVRRLAYEYMLEYGKGSLRDAFLIYYIRSLMYWCKKQKDDNVRVLYYDEMRKLFKTIVKKHDIRKIKKYIKYKDFLKILRCNYEQNQLFFDNKKIYKTISILGIKIKYRKYRKLKAK